VSDLRQKLADSQIEKTDHLALQARYEAQQAEIQELRSQLLGSDEAREAALGDLRSKGNALEEARKDILDIQLAEKSAREHHQAEVGRCHDKCEALNRQTQEHLREVEELRGKSRGLEEALGAKGLLLAKAQEELSTLREEHRSFVLAKSSRDAAEATSSALQDGLKDKELCAHQKLLELQKRCNEQELKIQYAAQREKQLEEFVDAAQQGRAAAVADTHTSQKATIEAQARRRAGGLRGTARRQGGRGPEGPGEGGPD